MRWAWAGTHGHNSGVLVVHCGLRCCLRRRGLGVALDRVGAELRARNELSGAE